MRPTPISPQTPSPPLVNGTPEPRRRARAAGPDSVAAEVEDAAAAAAAEEIATDSAVGEEEDEAATALEATAPGANTGAATRIVATPVTETTEVRFYLTSGFLAEVFLIKGTARTVHDSVTEFRFFQVSDAVAVAAKGEESAEGAATEAARRAAGAAEEAVGATADAAEASRTGSTAERGGATKEAGRFKLGLDTERRSRKKLKE